MSAETRTRTTAEPGTSTGARTTAGPRTLDELAQLGPEELMRLYREAKTPRVEDLEGALEGRMLAMPAAHGLPVVPALLRRFAATGAFPWQGKTFKTLAPGRGEGVNRVLGNRWDLFRFETSVGTSRAGAFDAVHLDYDNPGNPGLIRAIKDEVREIAPGLWLGLAYLKVRRSFHLVVFFALAKK